MRVISRTWLATLLFVVVSTAIWWRFIDWSTAVNRLVPTLLLTPAVWGFVVGRRSRPHLVRGMLGGALAGAVTQSAQGIPKIVTFYLHRGTANGEAQAVAMGSVVVYLFIGFCATAIGSLLGLVALLLQRNVKGEPPTGGRPKRH